MAEPQRAVVSRFRWNHVGRADVLLHVARRPVWKAREESGRERDGFGGVDGAQRRLLHRRETKVAGRGAGTGPLVSLGSVDDVAERRSSTRYFVLLGRWAHRSGRCGHFQASGHCDWIGRPGGGLVDLRSGGAVTVGKVAGRVRGIWSGDDGGGGLGIAARVQWPR